MRKNKMRRQYRRRSNVTKIVYVLLSFILLVVLYKCTTYLFHPERKVEDVIKQFYTLEQTQDFSSSWELFHSSMKEKFDKSTYIQDRSHVFFNHFDVDTFSFTYTKLNELASWKMDDSRETLTGVYEYLVITTYKSKYGNIEMRQNVYLTLENEKWVILWDYNF